MASHVLPVGHAWRGQVIMDCDKDKYYAENPDALSKAGKLQMARDLRELELQCTLENRGGMWRMAGGVEIEDTSQEPFSRVRKTEKEESSTASKSSVRSSGEPSKAQIPQFSPAAWPSSEGASSPDSMHADGER